MAPNSEERSNTGTPQQAGLFAVPPDELDFVRVPTTAGRFHAAILRHYTKSEGAPPGKKIGWEITEGGRTVGYVGLGEPAFKLAPRRRLGLVNARPLEGTVSNFIYRLEGPRLAKASTILRAWHVIATRDWLAEYGWAPVHWETMVGQGVAGNLGACFRRAGYRALGWTTGRTARRPLGHRAGPRVWGDGTPKLVLYRGPLARLPEVA